MSMNQPNFQSLRKINDSALLLSVANEYLGENVHITKIGLEIKDNLSVLKDDIKALKKQFPGKFTTEINTDKILNSFESTAQEMLSGSDEVKKDCISGKLGMTLDADVSKITEAIDKIWQQVKGTDVKYTKTDSISGFFSRLNLISGVVSLFSGIVKILMLFLIIILAGFSFLYFTMEKESTILNENKKIMAIIEEKKAVLKDLERKKAEAQKSMKPHESGNLQRTDKIAIIDYETQVQEANQEIHTIEGQIQSRKEEVAKNDEKLKVLKGKSFMERLLRQ